MHICFAKGKEVWYVTFFLVYEPKLTTGGLMVNFERMKLRALGG